VPHGLERRRRSLLLSTHNILLGDTSDFLHTTLATNSTTITVSNATIDERNSSSSHAMRLRSDRRRRLSAKLTSLVCGQQGGQEASRTTGKLWKQQQQQAVPSSPVSPFCGALMRLHCFDLAYLLDDVVVRLQKKEATNQLSNSRLFPAHFSFPAPRFMKSFPSNSAVSLFHQWAHSMTCTPPPPPSPICFISLYLHNQQLLQANVALACDVDLLLPNRSALYFNHLPPRLLVASAPAGGPGPAELRLWAQFKKSQVIVRLFIVSM